MPTAVNLTVRRLTPAPDRERLLHRSVPLADGLCGKSPRGADSAIGRTPDGADATATGRDQAASRGGRTPPGCIFCQAVRQHHDRARAGRTDDTPAIVPTRHGHKLPRTYRRLVPDLNAAVFLGERDQNMACRWGDHGKARYAFASRLQFYLIRRICVNRAWKASVRFGMNSTTPHFWRAAWKSAGSLNAEVIVEGIRWLIVPLRNSMLLSPAVGLCIFRQAFSLPSFAGTA
jgi:hypothetical protein